MWPFGLLIARETGFAEPDLDLSFLIREKADETHPFQLGHRGMLPGMHNLWYMYDGRYKDGRE